MKRYVALLVWCVDGSLQARARKLLRDEVLGRATIARGHRPRCLARRTGRARSNAPSMPFDTPQGSRPSRRWSVVPTWRRSIPRRPHGLVVCDLLPDGHPAVQLLLQPPTIAMAIYARRWRRFDEPSGAGSTRRWGRPITFIWRGAPAMPRSSPALPIASSRMTRRG
ncbi:MAG: hypothetical protein R2705_17635 [Ilumatobacteraceae bacterium]